MKVRSSVKGIVIKDQQLLTIKKYDDSFGADYSLPGGGQEHGETLHDALKREFLEEIGCRIEIKQFAFLREYIGRNHHGSSQVDTNTHVVDHLFVCELLDEHWIGKGTAPDEDEVGIEWIPISQLSQFRFFPAGLIPYFKDIASGSIPQGVYVGDVN